MTSGSQSSLDFETLPWGAGCEVPSLEDVFVDQLPSSPSSPPHFLHQGAFGTPAQAQGAMTISGCYAYTSPPDPPRRWSEETYHRQPHETRKLSEGSCVKILESEQATSYRPIPIHESGFASHPDVADVTLTIVDVKTQEAFMTWTFTDTSVKVIPVTMHPSPRHRKDWDSVLSDDEDDDWRRVARRGNRRRATLATLHVPSSMQAKCASEPELDKFLDDDYSKTSLSKQNSCEFLDRAVQQDTHTKKSRKRKTRGGSYKRKLSDSAFFRRLSGSALKKSPPGDPGRVTSSSSSSGGSRGGAPHLSLYVPDVVGHLYPVSSDSVLQDGKPKDYQLWVLSGKEESPYPLIGE